MARRDDRRRCYRSEWMPCDRDRPRKPDHSIDRSTDRHNATGDDRDHHGGASANLDHVDLNGAIDDYHDDHARPRGRDRRLATAADRGRCHHRVDLTEVGRRIRYRSLLRPEHDVPAHHHRLRP